LPSAIPGVVTEQSIIQVFVLLPTALSALCDMHSHMFGAFIQVEASSQPLETPAAVIAKERPTIYHSPTVHELDELRWGARLTGPSANDPVSSTPVTPRELEQSAPPTPTQQSAVDVIQSVSSPKMNRWRVAACGLTFFTTGINDSAPGALIPYLEIDYKIGYAIVSLIFITNAVGFISAAPSVQAIQSRWGRARAYILATGLMNIGYIALVCNPPFPVVVISFLLLGFGMAMILAMNNVFIVNLVNGTVILGAMHGCYGVGGIVSPLMATAMVSHGIHWSHFYFISLSLALSSLALTAWSFWNFEKELPVQLLGALERTASRRAVEPGEPTRVEILKRALKNHTTLLGALFIFAYQGAEVTISGWVISFLISYRNGDPAHVGYVTSGFWAGITLGRFVLVHPAHKIGGRISVVALVMGCGAFQLLLWFVPNIVGDAVAVAIVGLLLGPVYPLATGVFSKLLPRTIQMSSLGFVASMGSSGGALAPFLTGLLAQTLGTVVLNPICIVLFIIMEAAWFFLPKEQKRRE
jgi:fucose permease